MKASRPLVLREKLLMLWTMLDNFWYNANRRARHFVTPGI